MRLKVEMKGAIRLLCVASASALVLAAPLAAAGAEGRPTPGFNLFSVEQDVEIGRQSAVEAERQLPMLNDRDVDRYLNRVIARLADQAPGGDYPYAIKAVNAPEINAFSLPGGPMYVNRGLVEAARSEAELVGVLAHEEMVQPFEARLRLWCRRQSRGSPKDPSVRQEGRDRNVSKSIDEPVAKQSGFS
jgi:predicted Zn-dependent protease